MLEISTCTTRLKMRLCDAFYVENTPLRSIDREGGESSSGDLVRRQVILVLRGPIVGIETCYTERHLGYIHAGSKESARKTQIVHEILKCQYSVLVLVRA